MPRLHPFAIIVALAVCLVSAMPSSAADEKSGDAGKPDDAQAAVTLPPSIVTALPAFADVASYRQRLAEHGVQYQFNYIGDAQGNLSGGIRRGAIYTGRLETVLDVDLEKFANFSGGAVHFNAYSIHGRGLSRYNLTNIMPTSNIEALSTTRLYEAWYEQKLGDKVSFRAGQLGADVEFLTTSYGALFVNGTFGWPAITAVDLPSGGPAYPLATPGARLKVTPTDNITLLAAIFNGDPAGPGTNDPQRRNRFGVNFRLRDPPFFIGEAQVKYGSVKDGGILPGTIKFGAWGHLGRFNDLRLSAEGISTADPASSGNPFVRRGNGGIYGVIDQMIYHLPGEDADKGIGVFARASGSPSDRNLVNFYVDAGVNFIGMIPGRPDDSFGLAGAYTRISPNAALLDQQTAFFTGNPTFIRNYGALIEFSYQAQIMTGWSIQPNFQYIFHPGGNVANPNDPTGLTRIRDAAVLGVRSTVRF